ncbi:hypothetical protein C8R46DRAFT_288082 [Mycena filopes]|nr:hypothetical protein C8R46DRAFT_288082 [Mycena filopes]
MSTAQNAGISAPELLELILAQLPMRDLLVVAPRVSKTWNAVTLTPTLQRAVFLRPDPTALSTSPVLNPLLMEIFSPFFAPKGSHPSAESITSMQWAGAPEAFRRVDASWRRMLVTQPPVQTLLVRDGCRARGEDFRREATVQCDDASAPGLRMGALYDIAVSLIDRPASSFHVYWPGHDGLGYTDGVLLAVYYVKQCRR